MKISFRRSLRIIAPALLLLAAVIAAMLHTAPVRRYVLAQVQRDLHARLEMDLQAAQLQYNLFQMSFRLEDLRLQSTSAPELPPLAAAREAAVDLSLWSLIRGEILVEDARIEGLTLHWIRIAEGQSNIPAAPAAQTPADDAAASSWRIDHLEVAGASFRYEDRPNSLLVEAPDLSLQVDSAATQGSRQRIRLASGKAGRLAVGGKSTAIERMLLQAELDGDELRILHLTLDAGPGSAEASGALALASGGISLKASGSLVLDRLQDLLEMPPDLRGRVDFRGDVSGTLENLAAAGELSGADLAALGYEGLQLSARLSWQNESQRLDIPSWTIRSGRGRLQGAASLSLAAGAPGTLQAQADGWDLRLLTRRYPLPVEIDSRLSGSLAGRWAGTDFASAEAEASLRLRPASSSPRRGVLPLSASLQLNHSDGSTRLAIDAAEAAGCRLAGTVSRSANERVAGTVRLSVESLERLNSGLREIFGDRYPSRLADLNGSAIISGDFSGTTTQPVLRLKIDAGDLQFGGIREGTFSASAFWNQPEIQLERARLDWADLSVTAAGALKLTQASPTVDMRAIVERGSLEGIGRALGRDWNLEGTIRAEAGLVGTLDNLQGGAELRINQLKIWGEPLGELTAKSSLDGSLLTLQHLQIVRDAQSGRGSLEAHGSIDLQTREFMVETAANRMALGNLILPGEISLRGLLDLRADGSGNLTQPRLEATLNLAELSLADRPIGDVNADILVDGGEAALQLRAPAYRLTASTRIGLNAPYPADFRLAAEGTDLAKLGFEIRPEAALEGRVTANATGSGNLQEWQAANASVQISDLVLAVAGKEIRNRGIIRVGLDKGTLSVDQASLALEESRIEISGTLPLLAAAPPGRLQFEGGAELASLHEFLPAAADLAVEGALSVEAALEGTRDQMSISADARLIDGVVRHSSLESPLTNLQARLRVRDGILTLIDGEGDWAGGKIRARAQLPLGLLPEGIPLRLEAPPGEASFSLDMENLQAASIPGVPEGAVGSITLHAEGEAGRLEMNALKARISVDKLGLKLGQFEINQERPALLTVKDGLATIDEFLLTGPRTRIEAGGTVGLTGDRVADVDFRGRLAAGLLTFRSDNLRAAGDLRLNLKVSGLLADPKVSGSLEADRAQLRLLSPRLQADQLDLRLSLADNRVTIDTLACNLNGGRLEAGGGLSISEGGIDKIALNATARNVLLDFPAGLRSAVNADLTLRNQDEIILLGGTAHVMEGSYRKPVDLEGEILRFLRSDQSIAFAAEPDPLLSRLRYSVALDTPGPVVVDNNLAKLALNGNLRLIGTYYRPVITGRITLEEGGELYLSERTYLIDRGTIDFANPSRIEPSLDFLARTQVDRYDINLTISGTSDDLSTSLSSPSDPELSEQDLVSLLLTGRTLEQARGEQLEVAQEQALSYLVGRVGRSVTRQAEEALGLSQVRLEPNLISPESDPGARLTVAQDLTRDFRLIYSMDLANSQAQTWIADYNPRPRFNTRAIKQDDNSFRFDFRHDLRLGKVGAPAPDTSPRPRQELRIGQIELQNRSPFPDAEVFRRFRLRTGDKYDFFKVQNTREELSDFFTGRGFPEASVDVEKQVGDRNVDLTLSIDPGPRVTLRYEGFSPAPDLQEAVAQAWRDGVFDTQRVEEATRLIREALVGEQYLQPEVSHRIEDLSEDAKLVVFRVDRGTRYTSVALALEGASVLTQAELESRLEAAGQALNLYVAPDEAADFVADLYRGMGYLNVVVSRPRLELEPQTGSGRVIIPVQEGPRFRFGGTKFSGNRTYSDDELRRAIPVLAGRSYNPEATSSAVDSLEDFYWHNGFNDVIITYSLEKEADQAVLNLGFEITENRQEIVREIAVQGTLRSSEDFVRSRLEIAAGDILDYRRLNSSRKKLYDTGAYSMVELDTARAEEPEGPPAPGRPAPVNVRVIVRELQPYRIRYGGFYDTDRGPGAIVEATRRNFFGGGRSVGLQGRYDGDIHELRGFYGQPFFRRLPLKTTATAFIRREVNPTFFNDRIGFSLQQEAQLHHRLILSYGYRYERTHTFDKEPDPIFPFDITLPVAQLTTSLTRESRDDFLDATRGSFTSHALGYAPKALGSDIRFIRYFGQYFKYLPLSQPTEIPWSGGLQKSRLVYAVAARIGLVKGLDGQDVLRSERFFTGGGTSIRGFEQDSIGPVDFFGDPTGGDALFILNNEMRFPIFHILDGVGFLDLGNVYRKISDFDPFDVRASAGLGLRLRTPFVLLRLDYGFKLDRRQGESRGKLFFSIGQAF